MLECICKVIMSAEIWQATDYESVKEKSRTKPLVLWCEHESDDGRVESKRFLVKSPGHPEVLESNLFAELFGNLLAREFKIATPKPAIIVLTEPFVQSIQPLLPSSILLRVGYGVGCEYLPEIKPLLSDFKIPAPLRSQATMIYALDLVTANTDRRIGNSNCALWNNELLAYDFELSFSFLQALFGPRPWLVSQLGIAQIHIFQRELKASGTDWRPFLNALKLLDAQRFAELVKDFPAPWLSNSERVFDYLLEAQAHSKQLIVEMETTLHI